MTDYGLPEADDRQQAEMTPRQRDVAAILATGVGNKAIAAALGISTHTVRTHLEAIFQTLNVNTRAQAAVRLSRINPAYNKEWQR